MFYFVSTTITPQTTLHTISSFQYFIVFAEFPSIRYVTFDKQTTKKKKTFPTVHHILPHIFLLLCTHSSSVLQYRKLKETSNLMTTYSNVHTSYKEFTIKVCLYSVYFNSTFLITNISLN